MCKICDVKSGDSAYLDDEEDDKEEDIEIHCSLGQNSSEAAPDANDLFIKDCKQVMEGRHCQEIGSRWRSRRMCTHSLLRQHQNHN